MRLPAVFKSGIVLVVLGIGFVYSCNKPPANSSLGNDDNGGYASDASRIELFTDDAISLMDIAGTYFTPDYIADSTLATVTWDTIDEPRTLQVIFSATQDATCLDGRKRRGSVSVTYSGRYSDTGTANIHNITFNNYYVDGYQVSGTIQYVRIDTTVIGNWYYQVYVNDSVTITPGSYVTWNGTMLRQWIAGDSTATRTDDVFSISGNPTLMRPDMHRFTFSIAAPWQVALNYNYVEAGSANIAGPQGARTINYGNGYTDNIAQLYFGGNEYTISLSY